MMSMAEQSSSFPVEGEYDRLQTTFLTGLRFHTCENVWNWLLSAGQYKRIVRWPGSIDNISGVIEIDSPFVAALDETSMVDVMPFRGKNIFHNTHYSDVGVKQSHVGAPSF